MAWSDAALVGLSRRPDRRGGEGVSDLQLFLLILAALTAYSAAVAVFVVIVGNWLLETFNG